MKHSEGNHLIPVERDAILDPFEGRRKEIYDKVGIQQVVHDINFTAKYLAYLTHPGRIRLTDAILDDLSEPEEAPGPNDIHEYRGSLHALRQQLIAIDQTAAYTDLPIKDDLFADLFSEAFEQDLSVEQRKALEVLQKIYRLNLFNPAINNTPNRYIPTFIDRIAPKPRPDLRIVE